jgi:hypothetical protein
MGEFHGPGESDDLYEGMEADQQYELGDLTGDEAEEVNRQVKALDKFFADQPVRAKYKVEIQFGKERSTWKSFAGAMSLFLSGTKFHGGGDEKLYICPDRQCKGVIYPEHRVTEMTKDGKAIARVPCPVCTRMWAETDLIGELLFKLAPREWATVIHRMFARLEHNADIYVKYHWTDIRHQAEM